MIQAIGGTLPIITAVMISPIPIAGLFVVLTSRNGPVKSIAYGMGFFLALWLPTFLLAWTGKKTIGVSGSGASPTLSSVVHGGLGVVLLVVAIVAFIKYRRKTAPATEPGWVKTLDSAPMLMILALGGFLAIVNPKNPPLVVSAAVDYAQASLNTVQLAIVVTAFAAIGSLLIFLPIVLVHLARKPAARLCHRMRPWLLAHSAIVLAVICAIVGVAMLGRAFSASF